MAIFSNVEHLKMWVHKILPLVYDDSMSYYETLCKVVAKLNEVVTLSNEQTDYLNNWLTTTEESLERWKDDTETSLENKITTDLGAAIDRLETEFADELLDAEGMIYGTQNGQPVEEGSEYYQNNAEYFKERASASAIESRAYANGENASPLFANNNSKYFRERSEAWAVGEINGVDVPDTDDTHENNAKYYAEQAREAALTFVPDPTLTEANRPAEAKATGDAIADLKSATIRDGIIEPSDYETDVVPFTISGSNKTTRTDTRVYSSYQIPRNSDWDTIKITTQTEHGAFVLFLNGIIPYSTANNTDVSSYLATGETERHYLTANTSESFTLPDDCANIFLFKVSADVNVVPTAITYMSSTVKELDSIHNDISRLEEDIEKTESEHIALDYSIVKGYSINNETGGISTSTTYDCTDYIDVSRYNKIYYKRIQTTAGAVTIKYSGTAFYDSNKNYMFGIISDTVQSETAYIDYSAAIPPEVHYVRFTVIKDNYDSFSISADKRIINKTDYQFEPDFPFIENKNIIYYDESTPGSDFYALSDYILCEDFDYIKFSKLVSRVEGNKRAGLGFYDANKSPLRVGSGMFYDSEQEVGFIVRDGYVSIPDNAKYVRFQYLTATNMVTYTVPDPYIFFYKLNSVPERQGRTDGLTTALDGLYFRKPKSKGVENAIRNMHQLANVIWRAKHNFTKMLLGISHNVIRSEFLAGITYRGIPYSITPSRLHNVGIDASIDTFMSAVENENSRLYDTSVSSFSDYSYYGNVCSSFVDAVLNIKGAPVTEDMADIKGFRLIASHGNFNEKTLELGDILLYPTYHVMAVSGIICDSYGHVKWVEISESQLFGYIEGGKNVSRWFDMERFKTRVLDDQYDLYRYDYIDDVEYNESDFAQVFPESESRYDVKKYCYPIFGDKCVIASITGSISIMLDSEAYTDGIRALNVYHNGQLLSENAIGSDTTEIAIDRITGEYLGVILDGDGKVIDTISWSIAGGTFSKSLSENTLTVTYDTPYTIYGVSNDSGLKKYTEITPVTGTGTFTVELPGTASNITLVIGNKNGLTRISI